MTMKRKKLPCHTCGSLKLSCCQDAAGIVWRDNEIGRLLEWLGKHKRTADGLHIFRDSNITGIYHILDSNNLKMAEATSDNPIDAFSNPHAFCPFYNQETFKCSVYPVRPEGCRSFGKEVTCPYENVKPAELIKANEEKRGECIQMHKVSGTNLSEQNDYIKGLLDYSTQVTKSDTRYKQWKGFPELRIQHATIKR